MPSTKNPKAVDALSKRKQDYLAVLGDEKNKQVSAVLYDLAVFCRANESTFHENSHIASKLDGRREVWLRITEHLNLSVDNLYSIFVEGNHFK